MGLTLFSPLLTLQGPDKFILRALRDWTYQIRCLGLLVGFRVRLRATSSKDILQTLDSFFFGEQTSTRTQVLLPPLPGAYKSRGACPPSPDAAGVLVDATTDASRVDSKIEMCPRSQQAARGVYSPVSAAKTEVAEEGPRPLRSLELRPRTSGPL